MHSRYPHKTPGIKNSCKIARSCSTPTIRPSILPTLDLETFHTTAALTNNSLVVASTNLEGRFD